MDLSRSGEKRKNGIFKYHTVEDIIYGESYTKEENYDLMEVVVLNLGDADKSSDLEILDLLNVLFSAAITPEEKKQRLNDEFEIAMTVEFESEVQEMCNLSKALVEQGIKQGIKQGIELGKEERTLSMAQMMIQERELIENRKVYRLYIRKVKRDSNQNRNTINDGMRQEIY